MNRIPRKVIVRTVDEYGFCGRENHPSKADIGTTLTVVKVEPEYLDGFDATLGDLSYDVWYCKRPDGSPVEMIEFEIEPAPDSMPDGPAFSGDRK